MTLAMNNLSVLVVDDDKDQADALTRTLLLHGLNPRSAYSAKDAGMALRDGFRPAAVVMDLNLPRTDGYAVARELCASLPTRPFLVALTGHSDLDCRSLREGFDHHYVKPADPAALAAVLRAEAVRRYAAPA
ncbi:response regulator [Zavarzinella formosa]|uniref:response regulator n=1 Tax=Zavarzinella formosa TaxID=360055 RepID=UPI0002E7E767|nr:response regulator [Zavarzinella formosa]